jgi:Flp pilus assembly protein TadG
MGTFESARRAWHWLRRYGRDRRGNISSVVALLIIPLVGVIGIATETGNWFLIQRSAQNAADSAVLAAGQNDYINPSGTS